MRARADAFQHIPMHHSVRKEDHRRFGGETSVLFLRRADDSWARYQPLEDFSHAHSMLSDASRRKAARGLGLLYDFVVQNMERYLERFGDEWASKWRMILQDFCNALRYGTIEGDFTDRSGLFWPPTTSESVLSGWGTWIDRFLDWMVDEERTDELAEVLPFFGSVNLGRFGVATRVQSAARYRFLAHLKPKARPVRERQAIGAAIFKRQPRKAYEGADIRAVPLSPNYAFPTEHVVSLIDRGFIRDNRTSDLFEKIDYTGRMDALISFGGLRGSERLHMWVNDLQIVEGSVKGFLRHPEKFVENCGRSREQVLLERYDGLRPRTLGFGREKVGFKNPRLNANHWASIHWLPFEGFQEYFVEQLRFYVGVYRKEMMDRRRRKGIGDHPFLLVTSHHCESKGQYVGDPISSSAMVGRWKRAVEGVGLKYGKEFGTTRHGSRHLFGQTLVSLGTPIQDIAAFMHHRSMESPWPYITPSDDDAHATFEENRATRPEVLAALGSLKKSGGGSDCAR